MFTLSAFADEISPDPQEADRRPQIVRRPAHRVPVDPENERARSDRPADFGVQGAPRPRRAQAQRHRLAHREDSRSISRSSRTSKSFGRAIELCKVFGTPNIRIFSYYPPETFDGNWAPYRAEVLRRIRATVELAEKNGLTLFHENEHRIYGDSPDGITIFSRPSRAKLQSRLRPGKLCLLRLRPSPGLGSVQTPHRTLSHQGLEGRRHARQHAGEGQGQIPAVIADAVKSGYSGFATMEPHLLGGGPTGGVTGPELFPKAVAAFKAILEKAGAKYQ